MPAVDKKVCSVTVNFLASQLAVSAAAILDNGRRGLIGSSRLWRDENRADP